MKKKNTTNNKYIFYTDNTLSYQLSIEDTTYIHSIESIMELQPPLRALYNKQQARVRVQLVCISISSRRYENNLHK